MLLPNDTERHAIFGMTGSGKTVFGLWALSHRSYDRMPWTVIDFKGDENIEKIPGIREIGITDRPPRRPGLYRVQPLPSQEEEVDKYLMKVWAQENHGIFLDEGYMIGRFNKALRAILTQGRAKRTPAVILSQRPAWIHSMILSESEFITCFFLHTDADVRRIGEFMPGVRADTLAPFHSYHWQVKQRELHYLSPVPDMQQIFKRFDAKRPPSSFWG